MEVSGQMHAPVNLLLVPTGQVSWVGTGVALDTVAKRKKSLNCLCRESNPYRPACSLVALLIHTNLLCLLRHLFKHVM